LTVPRKVLLDSNVPHDLRPYLTHHRTFTAAYLGWQGLKNGELLDAAEAESFDVLVTRDLRKSHPSLLDLLSDIARRK
jgi:hypothetical protein